MFACGLSLNYSLPAGCEDCCYYFVCIDHKRYVTNILSNSAFYHQRTVNKCDRRKYICKSWTKISIIHFTSKIVRKIKNMYIYFRKLIDVILKFEIKSIKLINYTVRIIYILGSWLYLENLFFTKVIQNKKKSSFQTDSIKRRCMQFKSGR